MARRRDEDLALISGYLHREQGRHAARESPAYDGVLGVLPDWNAYTAHDRREFVRLRNKLLDHYWPPRHIMRDLDPQRINRKLAKEIKKWVISYHEGRASPWPPPEFEEVVARLATYWGVYQKGAEAGRQFYIGKNKANVAAGKAKSGKEGVVTRLVKALKVKTLDELLRHIELDIDEGGEGNGAIRSLGRHRYWNENQQRWLWLREPGRQGRVDPMR